MKYWVILNNQQSGPYDLNQMAQLPIQPDTMVYAEGAADWTRASNVPELVSMFTSRTQGPAQAGPYYAPGMYQGMPPCPPTNLVWAILTTVLCCLPFGVVAIVKASNVSSCYQRGDYNGALANSRSAAKWSIASAVCSVVFLIIYFILIAVFGLSLAED